MEAERWKKIEDLYHAALVQPAEKRAEFMQHACPGDPELCAEVESLLKAAGEESSFLEGSPISPMPPGGGRGMSAGQSGANDQGRLDTEDPTRTIGPNEAAAGSVIGSYHLLQPIGQGGMGEVWLAEQKQPVRRRVALKLIKAGMDTREVVARFESERQALALMDHPAIAKVFDAGSTPGGRPYFVMEYVAGIPITVYCDKHKLTIRQRLELFIQVCEGVQHAHQKAILHRDLKPSNILVSEVDGKPAPRIIDFGVAKATAQRLTADTMYTRVGMIVGTPGYMSPEQADSAGADVDTRTDVYSLGVVLYELLVGVLPLDFSKTPPDQFPRRLRDEDAPRPSTKLRSLGEQTGITAQNRGADRPTLARQLRGDMDAITLKALEKDRSRRYATPSELAADVGRYLRNEPVTAHPPSAGYRARKYIRRHRLGVAVVGTGALLLVAFSVAEAVELRRITRERDRADRISRFMTSMFQVPNPSEARGNTVTARELLDKASKEIGTGLSNDPELQAKMMYTMAGTYDGLGLYSRAQPLLEGAVEIQRRVLGPRSPDTLRSMSYLAEVLSYEGHYAESEKLLRETLDIERRVLGPEHPDTGDSMRRLAATLHNEGRFAEAEKLQRETLDIERRVLGPEQPATLRSTSILALTLQQEGRFAESEKLLRETLDIERRVLGPENPGTLNSMQFLALTVQQEGRYAEAEKLYRETLDIQRRVLGPEHRVTLNTLELVATNISNEGRYGDAEKLFREAIQAASKANQPGVLADAWYNFACMAAPAGRRDEALRYLAQAIDHGYQNPGEMAADDDLKPLHGDPRFEALLAEARRHAAKTQ